MYKPALNDEITRTQNSELALWDKSCEGNKSSGGTSGL